MTMPVTGLQEFKAVLKSFRELGSWAVKGVVAAPLVNLWTKFGPPPTVVVSILTSAVQFLGVMWVFHFWYGTGRSPLDRRMKICAGIFCVALLASGILLSQFTDRPLPDRDRIVYGFVLRPDVQPLISATYTTGNALQGAEYDPARVWTRGSITAMHMFLVTSWIVTFGSISMFIAGFIILQKRKSR